MMLSKFLNKQLSRAKYKILPDGVYFASIPGLRGVWASARTLEDCREELQSVLEDWLIFKLRKRAMVPGLRLPLVSQIRNHQLLDRYA